MHNEPFLIINSYLDVIKNKTLNKAWDNFSRTLEGASYVDRRLLKYEAYAALDRNGNHDYPVTFSSEEGYNKFILAWL